MKIHHSKVFIPQNCSCLETLQETLFPKLDTLCNMGFVEQFVALLQRDHDSTHEHLLAALLALTQGHPPSIEECRRSEFLLRELLDNRIELIKDRDECLVIYFCIYFGCVYCFCNFFNRAFYRKKLNIAARYYR